MLPDALKVNEERYYLQDVKGFFKAEVYIRQLGNGKQVVCKDYSRYRHNPITAVIARYLVQREQSVLLRLQDWVHAPKALDSSDPLILQQEYIAGKTLDHCKTCAPEVINSIVIALAELHAKNIIHNDVRASNVIIKTDGTPVFIDFTSAGTLPFIMNKVARWLMRQDVRHVIKFKKQFAVGLTADEHQLLQKPKWLQIQQRVWKEKILPFLKRC